MLNGHLEVTLANASENRLIADAAVKTDVLDVKKLAYMFHTGMLAESYVPSDEIRELRNLVHTQKGVVEKRTAKKTVLGRFSNEQIIHMRRNCSARTGQSSSQNSR